MIFRPLQGGRGQRAPVEEWPREREGNGRGGMAEREGMEKRTHRKKNRTPTPPQRKAQSDNGNAVPGTEKNSPPLNRPFPEISKDQIGMQRARARFVCFVSRLQSTRLPFFERHTPFRGGNPGARATPGPDARVIFGTIMDK